MSLMLETYSKALLSELSDSLDERREFIFARRTDVPDFAVHNRFCISHGRHVLIRRTKEDLINRLWVDEDVM